MKINLLAGVLAAALTLIAQQPKVTQTHRDSDGVQEAIAFQRAKDRADARQAKLESRHPSVDSNANRKMDDSTAGRHVADPGPAQVRKDKIQP